MLMMQESLLSLAAVQAIVPDPVRVHVVVVQVAQVQSDF